MKQEFYCGNGEPRGDPGCTYEGCPLGYSPGAPTGITDCTDPLAGPERCGDGYDNDGDGCAEAGCRKGKGACRCTKECPTYACGNVADCDPRTRNPEICNGRDDNCDGSVDEGCEPKGPSCAAKAGADPIILSNQSAVTEPFTDFAVEAVSRLSLTRTWTSMDGSFFGDPPGIFGRGWRHDWEGRLTCAEGLCIVSRGLSRGLQFEPAGVVTSLDGLEPWMLYRATALPAVPADHHDLLVRRPNGEWILFGSDGTESRFSVVCDACGGAEALCVDPLQGGVARLTSVTDPRGNVVHVGYARQSGLLLGLTDDLGHALEVRAAVACGDLASELRYDGGTVVTYAYAAGDLERATDADGATLRSYSYDAGGTGLLRAVLDESGTSIAEFSYDAQGRAIGVVDRASSVSISYGSDGWVTVTEFVGTTSVTSQRRIDLNGDVISVSDGCACGPARTLSWSRGNLVCDQDALGHSTYNERDQAGRVVHEASYSGTCPPPATIPAPSRERWFDQGLAKPIAQGVSLDLDRVRSESRVSAVLTSPTSYAAESFDYDPAPQPFDPAGYVCQQTALPVGAVVCREISSGYVPTPGGPAFERHATFYTYDARGRVVRKLGPVNLDRPAPTEVTPVEERTYWSDDASLVRRGRVRELKRYAASTAAPLVTSFDYDALGVYQTTAPDGGVTTSVHDARGRVRWSIAPDGARTEVRYRSDLSPRLVIAPSGAVTRFSHDAKGRPTLVEHLASDPDVPGAVPAVGWSELTQYDPAGNPVRVERRDRSGQVTWARDREFDVHHRAVREPHPELPGRARTWSYDSAGILTGTADEEDRTTTFTQDALQRVSAVTRSGLENGAVRSAQVATYGFEPRSDALTQVVGGSGATTSYRYDDFGRLQSIGDAQTMKASPIQFTYDARGNLLARTDGYVTVTYAYDGLDRVLTQAAANAVDGTSISYAYAYDENGAAGRLTSVTEPERTIRYFYDLVGRVTREQLDETGVATPLVTGYAYDPDGAISTITYPSGLRVDLVRDAATREITGVRDAASGASFATDVVHLPGGPVQSHTFGNGLTRSQAFNRRYEPVTVSSGPVALGYGMSPAGDVSTRTDGGTTTTFQYDFMGRLAGSGSLSYAYDGGGNRISETVDGVFVNHGYSGDRLGGSNAMTFPMPSGLAFSYDRQTNVSAIARTSMIPMQPLPAVCLRHDALGRLVLVGPTPSSSVTWGGLACLTDASVTDPVARFKYDHRARRVARWLRSSGEWTHVVSDAAGNPLSELARTGDPANPWRKVRDYVWLDGQPLAQIEYPGPGAGAGGYVNYFHLDHIGLPRALTNAAQQVVWRAAPRPYGEVVETTTPDPLSGRTIVTNLRLPGQYDERLFAAAGVSGLQGPYYNWNRWYLPSVGRYLELDPLAMLGKFNEPFGPDWYNYALGNPSRYTDPRGDTTSEMLACFLDPVNCMRANYCADEAFQATLRRFGRQGHNDASDAYRHCYWSCCMTKRMGSPATAAVFGSNHENFPENPQCERDMDEANNAAGRELGAAGADCDAMCSGSPNLQRKPKGPCTPCGDKRYGNYSYP